MRKKLVLGNWKLNGSLTDNEALVGAIIEQSETLQNVEVGVAPSFIHIPAISQQLSGTNVALSAQNLCENLQGAYTGEVSADMLAEFACKYAIIGHSERRTLYNESQDLITTKVKLALDKQLIPVYCIGETQQEREAQKTEEVLAAQLDPVIEAVGIQAFATIVIAYEPVWAIGTGLAASSQQAQDVHAFIRQRLADHQADVAEQTTILYGGSVKPNNAAELFSQTDIDGGLIGGASLKATDFMAIAQAAAA